MSTPLIPEPAALVISVLAGGNESAKDFALSGLIEKFGNLDKEIGPLAFDFTSYYDEELGKGIRRWLWYFAELFDRARLADIKVFTNELEQTACKAGKRTFNLDPGLLTLGNFVLATGKNNAHRIYLDKGIFADLTLIYQQRSYRPLPWTYPDYADKALIEILNELREQYKCKLLRQTPQPPE
jgi:hypothetical protein